MLKTTLKYISLVFYLLILSVLFGQSLPKGISVHRLNNGLEVILIENQSLPMVGVNVVVKTGSAYETFSTSGMSHMLEHLLFNGTTSRTQKELYDDTDRIGGYNNANTGEYYTNYMMVTPTEHIQSGMEIQGDMLFHSVLPEEKFEKEKGIVLEEIARSLAHPETQIERDIQSILFKGHSLWLPTLGTYSTIESLSLDAVRQYYKGNYLPNNMVLSIIGNFETEKMLEWVNEFYGQAAPGTVYRPTNSQLSTGFNAPDFTHGKLYHRSHSDSITVIHLVFQLPENPEQGFIDLLDESLSAQIESVETMVKKKFGKNILSLNAATHGSPIGNFLIVKLTGDSMNDMDGVISHITDAVHGMKFSMNKDAVSTFASKNKTSFYKSLEKPHMFGIYNAHIFAEKGIDGFLSTFDQTLYDKAAEKLKRFKLRGDPTVIIHHPMGENKEESVESTKAQLFDHDGSGTTLIAKQNANSPLMAVHYLFKHKGRLENEYGKDAAKILHDCFGQRMKSDGIQKKIASFGLSFTVNDNPFIPMDNIYLHEDFGYIRVEGLADVLENSISFLNDAFLNFIPTNAEFTKAVSNSHSGFGRMMGKNEAKDMFDKLVDEQCFGPDEQTTTAPELTYDSLLAFKNKYWIPENLIVSVISPQSPKLIQSLFSGFGNSQDEDSELAHDKLYRLNTETVSIEEGGSGSQSYLFWGFIKEIDPADKPGLAALSLVLADKIVFDIREKQGMAYRMYAGINIKNDKALFSIKFGTRPENVEVLVPQFPKLFSLDMLADLDDATLEKSVNMYLGRMMFRRLSSINQAYYLGRSQYFDGDMNTDAEFLEKLKSVTLYDVNRLAKKYLDGENPISIIVH